MRRNLGDDLDAPTHRLSKRIWWALYVRRDSYSEYNCDLKALQARDVLFSLSGFQTTRKISDGEVDTALLLEEDFEDTPHNATGSISVACSTKVQVLFYIENTKLAILGKLAHDPNPTPFN